MLTMQTDGRLLVGIIFFLIILAAYIIIFAVQYKNITTENERLVILATRIASFLPLYAVLMLISLGSPEALAALTVPIAFVEGYSFYAFFALLVTNLGGAAGAVSFLKGSDRQLFCCTSRCPTDPALFFVKASWALFHLVTYRVAVILLSAICFYVNSQGGKVLYVLFNIVGIVILGRSLIHFVLFYESIFSECKNLMGIVKVFLLKISVVLIVLQGLIAQIMVTANAEPYSDDSTWNSAQKTNRGYCLLVLLEFIILTIPYLIAFLPKIEPSAHRSADASTPSAPTFFHFICAVFAIHDVFGVSSYTDSMNALTGMPK